MGKEEYYKELILRFRDGSIKKYGGKMTHALNVNETEDKVIIRERPFLGREIITVVNKDDLIPPSEIALEDDSNQWHWGISEILDKIRKAATNGEIPWRWAVEQDKEWKFGSYPGHSEWDDEARSNRRVYKGPYISTEDARKGANNLLQRARAKVIYAMDTDASSDKIERLREEEERIQNSVSQFEKDLQKNAIPASEPCLTLVSCPFCHRVKSLIFSIRNIRIRSAPKIVNTESHFVIKEGNFLGQGRVSIVNKLESETRCEVHIYKHRDEGLSEDCKVILDRVRKAITDEEVCLTSDNLEIKRRGRWYHWEKPISLPIDEVVMIARKFVDEVVTKAHNELIEAEAKLLEMEKLGLEPRKNSAPWHERIRLQNRKERAIAQPQWAQKTFRTFLVYLPKLVDCKLERSATGESCGYCMHSKKIPG